MLGPILYLYLEQRLWLFSFLDIFYNYMLTKIKRISVELHSIRWIGSKWVTIEATKSMTAIVSFTTTTAIMFITVITVITVNMIALKDLIVFLAKTRFPGNSWNTSNQLLRAIPSSFDARLSVNCGFERKVLETSSEFSSVLTVLGLPLRGAPSTEPVSSNFLANW